MNSELKEIKNLIERSNNILLTTHERTDGDDLGTVLGLKQTLDAIGKHTHIAITGGVPAQLHFLPDSHTVTENIPEQEFDLLIISGCSQKERVGNPQFYQLNIPILNVDHHPDNSMFGDFNLVNAEKSSVAELIYDFINYTGWPMNYNSAVCLLTGIFTDTGSFMHSNTKISTLIAAAQLMSKGAHTAQIAKRTYKDKKIHALKAWSKAFSNTWMNPENKLIYSVLTEEDLNELGNPPTAIFEGFVETLNKVPSAEFALFIKQDGQVTKGSLRSDPHKNIDVGSLARTLGGGGHKWASGFSVNGKLTRDSQGLWQIVEPTNNTIIIDMANLKPTL